MLALAAPSADAWEATPEYTGERAEALMQLGAHVRSHGKRAVVLSVAYEIGADLVHAVANLAPATPSCHGASPDDAQHLYDQLTEMLQLDDEKLHTLISSANMWNSSAPLMQRRFALSLVQCARPPALASAAAFAHECAIVERLLLGEVAEQERCLRVLAHAAHRALNLRLPALVLLHPHLLEELPGADRVHPQLTALQEESQPHTIFRTRDGTVGCPSLLLKHSAATRAFDDHHDEIDASTYATSAVRALVEHTACLKRPEQQLSSAWFDHARRTRTDSSSRPSARARSRSPSSVPPTSADRSRPRDSDRASCTRRAAPAPRRAHRRSS